MRKALVRTRPYAVSIAVFAALTVLLAPLLDEGQITVAVLLFLLASLVLAARFGYATGMAAAALNPCRTRRHE